MKSVEIRLVGRFRLTGKLPGHHQHLLYTASHTQNDSSYILKGEQVKSRPQLHFLTILQQGKILQTMQGGIGIPHMQWCGQQQDYNFIVIEELQRNLETYFQKCENKFSFKTILMLGIEIISILQYFHYKNFIHNHLHPHHLMMGHGSKYGKLFLIDYSNASRYRDSQTLQHIEHNFQKKCQRRNFNLLFSSINSHQGHCTSRKDDLISLLYLMVYFMEGKLPWSHFMSGKKNIDQRSKQILQCKEKVSPQTIFERYPDLLMLYNYTNSLKFDEKPRYTYYRNVFRQRMQREGFLQDGVYDWMLLTQQYESNLQDFELNFEIVPNQEEFIKHLQQQMKTKEKIDFEPLDKKKPAQQALQNKTNKNDKECVIY